MKDIGGGQLLGHVQHAVKADRCFTEGCIAALSTLQDDNGHTG